MCICIVCRFTMCGGISYPVPMDQGSNGYKCVHFVDNAWHVFTCTPVLVCVQMCVLTPVYVY